MRYRLSERADRDVFDIYVFGGQKFGLDQADRYHDGLMEAFELLSERPMIGRERFEFETPIRVYIHAVHAILYRIDVAGILIVRVLHGSQDWRRHL